MSTEQNKAVVRWSRGRRLRPRILERETGFEPATFCLGSRHSAN